MKKIDYNKYFELRGLTFFRLTNIDIETYQN